MLGNISALRCVEHDQIEPCKVCAADRQDSESTGQPSFSRKHTPTVYTDRDMFIAMRSGLLGIAKVLERAQDPQSVAIRANLLAMSAAIENRFHLKKKL